MNRPYPIECPQCGHAEQATLTVGDIAMIRCPKCTAKFEFDTRLRPRSGYQGAVTHADPSVFAQRMRHYRQRFGKGARK